MLYTSKENQKIKEIKKLLTKKYRDETGLFLVEGAHLVEEALKSGLLKTLILLEGEAYSLPVNTIYVTKEILSSFSDLDSTPRVMGICEKSKEKEIKGNCILILDGIQDPGNLGTIIRSAVAFHVDTIVSSTNTVDFYNPKVLRSTQGMMFHLNLVSENLLNVLPKLKELGYKIVGTKVDGGIPIHKYSKKEKTVVIMGNEGNGMSEEVSPLCDEFLYIPMNEQCESLNVGVATSIILYELEVRC